MLLVLDNLEQVVTSAGALGHVLTSCPNVTMLITSREPLRLVAEHEYAVHPLVEAESVDLFLSRAQRVRGDIIANGEIAEICRRLDHLPLAIELAAARVKSLSPAQLLDRLEHRLPLLTGGARDAPDRQRTLRSTIEWSHDLLTEQEQRVFRGLSVFVGGCSLEAAEAVAGADLDTISSIVDKSLLRFDGERFGMLETIREYASERLDRAGETDELTRRHAEFFSTLAADSRLSAETEYGRRHDLALPELDNLRAAIDRAAAAGNLEFALTMAVSLENLWVTVDPFEGIRRFDTLMGAGSDTIPPLLRARALRCLSGCSELAGEAERSRSAIEASLALFREVGDERDIAVLLHRLGTNALNIGRPELARAPLEESLSIFRRVGSKRGVAQAIGSLGYLAREEGDLDRAIQLLDESREMVADSGFIWWEVAMLQAIADCTLQMGRIEETAAPATRALSLAAQVTDRQSAVFGLAHLACVAAERGDITRAGRLWGAIESEEQRKPIGAWESERDEYTGHVFAHAGPELDESLEEGRRLSLDEAVELALNPAG
jgi:predicted ATPase